MATDTSRRYWAFFADPKVFRVDDYLADVSEGNWTTKGKQVRAGDRALIWRGAGRGVAERGVVALADVIADPEATADPARLYWVEPAQADVVEERVSFAAPACSRGEVVDLFQYW